MTTTERTNTSHLPLRATSCCLLALAAAVAGSAQGPQSVLTPSRDDTVLARSMNLKPGTYYVNDLNKNGVLVITGQNITVDFRGATLISDKGYKAHLDAAEGTGVLIKNARNVTLKNATVRGYRWNIRVEGSQGVKIENCDVGFSRSQRIMNGEQPVNIFLDLRSRDAWRSYGAGIWVEKCSNVRIEKCRGKGAQNGALIVDSSQCTVHNNDFSFNSGWGIGFYGSSDNVASWNRCDFVNRPWGGGWGGDSAGLVVVNGSHRNMIIGNSLTHSGDGFFLTDHRNGGDFDPKTLGFDGSCNDNVIAKNDGSWSTANAFEGTFSLRNVYYANLANHSNYGFWLGYSSLQSILHCDVEDNQFDGIAIEQGQGIRVEGTLFQGNRGAAIHLWSSPNAELQALNPSKDHELVGNRITKSRLAYSLDNASNYLVRDDEVESPLPPSFHPTERREALVSGKAFEQTAAAREMLRIGQGMPKGFELYGFGLGPKGWEWIQFDAFAPRDFRGGLAAWRSIDAGSIELHLLDSKAELLLPAWIKATKKGRTATLTCAPSPDGVGEYRPYSIRLKSGNKTQELKGNFLNAAWDCKWYKWPRNDASAYTDDAAWKQVFDAKPIHASTQPKLPAIEYGKEPAPGTGTSYFALVAKTRIRFDAGKYRFTSLSDDGFRLFVDGKEVISRWNHHGATPDEAAVELAAGVHEIVVHYCQEFGGCVLLVGWEREAGTLGRGRQSLALRGTSL